MLSRVAPWLASRKDGAAPGVAVRTLGGSDTSQLVDLARQALDDVVTVGRKKLREKFFGSHPFAVESGMDTMRDDGARDRARVPGRR